MSIEKIVVPDVGGSKVDVIEILVNEGDIVSKGTNLLTVESEKASMDIPATVAGVLKKIIVKAGDKITEGDVIAEIEMTGDATSTAKTIETKAAPSQAITPATPSVKPAAPINTVSSANNSSFKDSLYAGPAVRRLAREFGIDLTQIKGTGEKDRITKEDVQTYVRARLAGAPTTGGLSVAPAPVVDFSKFGEIEVKPLSKINKFTGANLHRNWVTIPHVTQFDEADITDMDAFRVHKKNEGVKLTPIVFIIKAVIAALKKYPRFNSSLDASGENLIYKKYFNIGVAVDTPNGLVVPVIRNADQKGLVALAEELVAFSQKAREKGLAPADMQGSCFAISSLGGIGGTAFTPIVNAPDVAILGLSKSQIKPVWNGKEFVPRLMLPLSLSYDHRVIDGAEAARFTTAVSEALQTVWDVLL